MYCSTSVDTFLRKLFLTTMSSLCVISHEYRRRSGKNGGQWIFLGASNFSNLLAPWASGSRSLMLRAAKRASHRILHLEQIESSKTILYESCQGIEGERMKKRKQPNKHLNNIRDIIDRFNEVGLVAPQFVTHNLSKLTPHVQVFQSHNDTWRRTEVIITDKDMTERSVFATLFPAASLQLCLFHVLQSIRASREAIQGKSTMSEVQCKVGYHTKENSDLIISEDSRTFIEDKKQNALRDSKVDEFFGNVRKYFITVCDYLVVKLPLQNEVLKHAEVADVRLQKLLM